MAMTDSIMFGLDPGNADDLSLQEGAAVAKRSITRSLMAIYAPISTSDRGNRSPYGSLVALDLARAGEHACTIRPRDGAVHSFHISSRADAFVGGSQFQPHFSGAGP
jgi:hypothetical protein